MVRARDSVSQCQPALSDASLHYTRICRLALTATGINSKQPAFPLLEEYKSYWQRWKGEIGRGGKQKLSQQNLGALCTFVGGAGSKGGVRGEVLFDPELQETEHVKFFIPGISN